MTRCAAVLHPIEFALMKWLEKTLSAYLNSDSMNIQPQELSLQKVAAYALVSGGKDSTALLFALSNVTRHPHFRWKDKLDLYAIHCDHLTREGGSSRDAETVTRLCVALGVPLQVYQASEGLSQGKSFQERAWAWRKAICKKQALHNTLQYSESYFLTGHHAGDHLESVLMNLVRGAGPQGLKGLLQTHYGRSVKVSTEPAPLMMRPFLEHSQSELYSYFENAAESFIKIQARQNSRKARLKFQSSNLFAIDESNFSRKYTRNQMRLDIIPLLKQMNPRLESAVLRLSQNIANLEQLKKSECTHLSQSQKQKPIENPYLPIDQIESIADIFNFLKVNHPSYCRNFTTNRLENLLQHLQKWKQSGVKGRAQATTFVPLNRGWSVRISSDGLQFFSAPLDLYEEV